MHEGRGIVMVKGRAGVNLPLDEIGKICRKWQIKELALFGSVLRDDFSIENSDIDVLVTFSPNTAIGWEIVDVKDDLEAIFKRTVDLVEKEAVLQSKNPHRRREILSSCEVVYAQ